MGPQLSFENATFAAHGNDAYLGTADGANININGFDRFALTPFGRGLTSTGYKPYGANKWYQGRVDTPFYINVMTAPAGRSSSCDALETTVPGREKNYRLTPGLAVVRLDRPGSERQLNTPFARRSARSPSQLHLDPIRRQTSNQWRSTSWPRPAGHHHHYIPALQASGRHPTARVPTRLNFPRRPTRRPTPRDRLPTPTIPLERTASTSSRTTSPVDYRSSTCDKYPGPLMNGAVHTDHQTGRQLTSGSTWTRPATLWHKQSSGPSHGLEHPRPQAGLGHPDTGPTAT